MTPVSRPTRWAPRRNSISAESSTLMDGEFYAKHMDINSRRAGSGRRLDPRTCATSADHRHGGLGGDECEPGASPADSGRHDPGAGLPPMPAPIAAARLRFAIFHELS